MDGSLHVVGVHIPTALGHHGGAPSARLFTAMLVVVLASALPPMILLPESPCESA